MKPHPVLIDTGPIVAILSEADEYHERCIAELANLRPPLLTCWPVVTEAQWLLRHNPKATAGLFRAFESKLLALLPLDENAMPWLDAFLRRYRKIAPDLTDAALVYLAEREGISRVFTLDLRDFTVYRYAKKRHLTLIPTPAH